MPTVSFSGLLIVAIVAFAAPLLLALTPARRLPAIVLEIAMGIVIGPSVLGYSYSGAEGCGREHLGLWTACHCRRYVR
jgi:Kef-type K+ transport system membrane component KefB